MAAEGDDRVALAGEYVLGILSPAQRRAVEQRMAHDPQLARRVREWQDDLAALDPAQDHGVGDDPPCAPAPDLLDRIEAGLFAPPDDPAAR